MKSNVKKQQFLENIVASEVVDPDGVHHEFNQGLHGQKIDFDKIETDSELFWQWIEVMVAAIGEFYPEPPDALVGVANGTNRVVGPISEQLYPQPACFETEKSRRSQPVITQIAQKAIEISRPRFVLVVEDVGSTGTNSFSVARSIQSAGAQRVEVLNTLQRSPELELLQVNHIAYKSILKHVLPSYTQQECKKTGFCANGWELIHY